MEVHVYPLTPTELPVCAQEPHHTLFVRTDGLVSACISLARGGPSSFFGEDVVMPTVVFGRLPDEDLLDVWEGASCRAYRDCFEARLRAYGQVAAEAVSTKSPAAFERTMRRAAAAMPEALEGCRVCHYLYGV